MSAGTEGQQSVESLTGVRRAPSTVAALPDDLIGQTSIIDGETLEIHGITTEERRADFKPGERYLLRTKKQPA